VQVRFAYRSLLRRTPRFEFGDQVAALAHRVGENFLLPREERAPVVREREHRFLHRLDVLAMGLEQGVVIDLRQAELLAMSANISPIVFSAIFSPCDPRPCSVALG